ncbi:MAG: M61 family metallopeptidase [Planctomycetota bacterium]|jgi:predicted metalloprotease with PDZ domain
MPYHWGSNRIVSLLAALAVAVAIGLDAAHGAEPIELAVDASEAPRRILHARLAIPATPGAITLLYPKWIPGEHGPTGPITDLAGLKITAGGRAVAWRRDALDTYAIRCEVPDGAKRIDVALDFLSAPPSASGFTAGGSATTRLAVISWNQVLLYPRGRPAGEILYRAELTLPEGWELGTALPIESRSGRRTSFQPVSLETLIDSPVLCGEHFREVAIGPPDGLPHYLEMAADGPESLRLDPKWKSGCDRLVTEAEALFGARHYDSYRFLLTLSDHTAHFGLEHHESSDNRTPERMLIDEAIRLRWAGLLPHEFIHSWNGKYRRPADMTAPDYQRPLRTDLLWVYEGLTHYLTFVLTTRSGFWTQDQCREHLALVAEWLENRRGRSWRPLSDTAVAAQHLFGARGDWAAWRRGVDFYNEGVLIWLEVDAIIRRQTEGRRSLDDFCRAFFGPPDGPPVVKPYTFDDVVAALRSVAAHDWKKHLAGRVEAVGAPAPLAALERSGWRLAYADAPSGFQQAAEKARKEVDLSASIGLLLREDGTIADVIPGKAADRAGVAPATKLIAVNWRRYSAERLRNAVAATSRDGPAVELLVENGGYFASHKLAYDGGAKYPRLERAAETTDLLTPILSPKGNSQ